MAERAESYVLNREMSVSKAALFFRHRAKPGRREDVRRVWEKHVKPQVEANAAHEAYHFCFDDGDPDVICVFQLYSDREAMKAFLTGAWYPFYLAEVGPLVVAEPQVTTATPVWAKG